MGLNYTKKNKKNVFEFKFEDFIKNPRTFVGKMEKFVGKKQTDITRKHLDSIKSYKQLIYPDNTTNIESPEKEKFVILRKKLGYFLE